MQGLTILFYIIILIISVILHELAHGYAAYSQGDKTALYAGRLTLNPLRHLDLWGSCIIPLVLALSGTGFIIGWAKPVPYNPDNLRNKKWGTVLVASAGVLTNLFIALVFGLVARFVPLDPTVLSFVHIIIITNTVLAIFNLVPIPPLDGSIIAMAFTPARYTHIVRFIERYSFVLILIFLFYGWQFIQPLIFGLFKLFAGVSF